MNEEPVGMNPRDPQPRTLEQRFISQAMDDSGTVMVRPDGMGRTQFLEQVWAAFASSSTIAIVYAQHRQDEFNSIDANGTAKRYHRAKDSSKARKQIIRDNNDYQNDPNSFT